MALEVVISKKKVVHGFTIDIIQASISSYDLGRCIGRTVLLSRFVKYFHFYEAVPV